MEINKMTPIKDFYLEDVRKISLEITEETTTRLESQGVTIDRELLYEILFNSLEKFSTGEYRHQLD
jgi:hypothetical protein